MSAACGGSCAWPGLTAGRSWADDISPGGPAGAAVVGDSLSTGVSRVDERFTQRWHPCSGETFSIVAMPPARSGWRETRWRIDLAARTVSQATGPDGDDDTAWDIVGSAESWQAVLAGDANLGVAMRRCDLRYCDTGEAGPVLADLRIGMLADLLGLTPSWRAQAAADPARPGLAAHAR